VGSRPKQGLRRSRPPSKWKGTFEEFYALIKREQIRLWRAEGGIPERMTEYYARAIALMASKKLIISYDGRIIEHTKAPRYAPYKDWSKEQLAKETPRNRRRIKKWLNPIGPHRKGRPLLDTSRYQKFSETRIRRKRQNNKLAPSEVEWVRSQAGTGMSYAEIAAAFNAKFGKVKGNKGVRIRRETVFQIITYKTHVPKRMKNQAKKEAGAVDFYDLIDSEMTDEELDSLDPNKMIHDND